MPLGTGALDAFAPGAPVALEFAPEHLRVFAGRERVEHAVFTHQSVSST